MALDEIADLDGEWTERPRLLVVFVDQAAGAGLGMGVVCLRTVHAPFWVSMRGSGSLTPRRCGWRACREDDDIGPSGIVVAPLGDEPFDPMFRIPLRDRLTERSTAKGGKGGKCRNYQSSFRRIVGLTCFAERFDRSFLKASQFKSSSSIMHLRRGSTKQSEMNLRTI